MKKLLLETNAEDNAVNAAFMKDVLTPIVENLKHFEAFADWDSCEAMGTTFHFGRSLNTWQESEEAIVRTILYASNVVVGRCRVCSLIRCSSKCLDFAGHIYQFKDGVELDLFGGRFARAVC